MAISRSRISCVKFSSNDASAFNDATFAASMMSLSFIDFRDDFDPFELPDELEDLDFEDLDDFEDLEDFFDLTIFSEHSSNWSVTLRSHARASVLTLKTI